MEKIGWMELREEVAAELKLTVPAVKFVLDTFVNKVVANVSKGKTVCLTGFGKFYPRDKEAGMRWNPKAREMAPSGSRRTLAFKTSTANKDLGK